MLSERNHPCYRHSQENMHDTGPIIKEAGYNTWYAQSRSLGKTVDNDGEIVDTSMDSLPPQQEAGMRATQKARRILGNFFHSWNKFWKPGEQAATCSKEKDDFPGKGIAPASPYIPIFETTKYGAGQLTIPLGYNSAMEDSFMTPEGVYLEDILHTERKLCKKRRKQSVKSNQHVSRAPTNCGKNRKDIDLYHPDLSSSMDDSYGYDYREAPYYDAIDIPSLHLSYLSSNFSPSSFGSIGSFHDALQDGFVSVDREGDLLTAAVPIPENQPIKPASIAASLNTPPGTTVNAIGDLGGLKCDTEPDASEFVMYTDFDVFTTPSASPARRRTSRGLCKAFNFVWHRQHSGDSQRDVDDDAEGRWGYSSGDFTDDDCDDGESLDGAGGCNEQEHSYSDDDESVIFCEEGDDEQDDSNSSSGFEDRKVRFNSKPIVHVMRTWDFAYRQARKGDWEVAARDSERFRKRIAELEPVLAPALQSALRDRIYAERFSDEENTRRI
ncbi:uncharacterized protein LOC128723514 [Anopheles nili]|uniref:uncharacterized protein LOC128723514 n=1 Tax=Anopheles nili TaxID=185578 RepID=UPI00237BDED0|nr:uncharacterized protein LOC128723514 [Anopheles nili]